MRAKGFFAVLAFAVAGQAAGPLASDALAQTATANQPAPAASASSQDADVLKQTAMALIFARMIGVTGIEKAPTGAVKQLSLDVAEKSARLLDELNAAVKGAGLAIQLPTSLDAGLRDKAELLQSSFENQFEHEYLDMQIAAHRQVVAALAPATRGQTGAQSGAMSSVTSKIATEMSKNLTALETIKRQLPAM